MWDIDNHSPFPAAGSFQRDHLGRSLWCLWVRAGFALRAGRPPLFISQQTAPLMAPDFVDQDPLGLMRADTDQCLPKTGLDLVVHADGFAPDDPSTRPFVARAGWGDWSKAVAVHPAMVWRRFGSETVAAPAKDPVPLDWRAAWGGPDHPANPLGCGHHGDEKSAIGAPVARLFAQNEAPRGPSQDLTPVSFAPVPRGWPIRQRLGGTYDAAWERDRAPFYPADLDPVYWQSVPPDQVIDHGRVARLLAEGRRLTFRNMTASGLFETVVPDLDFECSLRFRGTWHSLAPQLQTIVVDLRQMTLAQTWMIAFPLGAAQFDVALERSVVALRGASGMVVHPSDAGRFAPGSAVQEIAA